MSRGVGKSFEELMEQTPESRKERKLRQILAYNNNATIWIGGSQNDRFSYPYRLIPVDRVSDRMRNAAESLMVDSSIEDSSIENKEVIEIAIQYNAQYVIPKDYWGDIDATQESIEEFTELYEKSGCKSTVIFPLQPPHHEHYMRYQDFFNDVSHLAIGGLKEKTPEEQLTAAQKLRNKTGPYKDIHGLGMGCSEKVINTLAEKPHLLDSFDTSSFERIPSNGKITGADWKQHSIPMPTGEDISTINALVSEWLSYMANYQLADASTTDTSNLSISESSKKSTNDVGTQRTLSDEWNTPKDDPDTIDQKQQEINPQAR